MTNPLIGIVELGLNAAENVAPEETTALLKGLGLSVSGLAAAAEENPEVAVAGVIVGAALVTAAGTALAPEAFATAIAAAGYEGTTAALMELCAAVGAQAALNQAGQFLTAGVVAAVSSVVNSSAYTSYYQQEIDNAQVQMEASTALLDAAGEGLTAIGQSLSSNLESIGNAITNFFSIFPNGSGLETLTLGGGTSDGLVSLNSVISSAGQVASATIDASNGTSAVETPSSADSQITTNWTGANGTGTLTGETIQATTATGAPGDQIQINFGTGSATASVADANGDALGNYSLSGTPTILIDSTPGTLAAITGSNILIDPGVGGTLMDYAPGNMFIDLSNNGSVASGANAQVGVYGDNTTVTNTGSACTDGIHCDGDIVNSNGGTVDVDSSSGVTVNGSGDTIAAGNDVTGTIDGSGNNFTGGTGDTLTIDGSDTVSASSGTIDLGTVSSDITVDGSGNSIGDAIGVNGGTVAVTGTATVFLSSGTVDVDQGSSVTVDTGADNSSAPPVALDYVGSSTSGSATSETIGVDTTDGTPEGSVQVTYDPGSTATTAVIVTDAAGNVESYTLSGIARVEDAMDSTATANGSGPTIEVGGDNATLTGGSGQNLLIELGNQGTVSAGSGTNQILLAGTQDTGWGWSGPTTLLDIGNDDTGAVSSGTITLDGTLANFGIGGDSSVTMGGSDNIASLGSDSTLLMTGTSDTVYAGQTVEATIDGSLNDLWGSGSVVATVGGDQNFVGTGDDSTVTVTGTNDGGGLGSGSTLTFGTSSVGSALDIGNDGSVIENGSSNIVWSGSTLQVTIGGNGSDSVHLSRLPERSRRDSTEGEGAARRPDHPHPAPRADLSRRRRDRFVTVPHSPSNNAVVM